MNDVIYQNGFVAPPAEPGDERFRDWRGYCGHARTTAERLAKQDSLVWTWQDGRPVEIKATEVQICVFASHYGTPLGVPERKTIYTTWERGGSAGFANYAEGAQYREPYRNYTRDGFPKLWWPTKQECCRGAFRILNELRHPLASAVSCLDQQIMLAEVGRI